VAPIIQICKHQGRFFCHLLLGTAALAVVFPSVPVAVAAEATERDLQLYFEARLAEIDDRNSEALSGYIGLFKNHADSPALADRLFNNAIRSGDMAAALQAARAQLLKDQADGAAGMLMFADAFKRRNWVEAEAAAAQIEAKSNYAFAVPVLRGWINVAKGKPDGLKIDDPAAQNLLNYYSTDQRVYYALAAGDYADARDMLEAFRGVDGDFARDLLIRAASIYAANGDQKFSTRLIDQLVERSYVAALTQPKQSKALAKITPQQGLATLNNRLAGSLIEQGVPDQALILARIAVWLDPESDAARRTLARSLQEQQLGDHAQKVWATIKPASPYWPRSVQEQARHFSDKGDNQTALRLIEAALAQQPNSSNLLLLKGQALEQLNDHVAAGEVFGRLAGDAEKSSVRPKQLALYLLFYATALDKGGKWDLAKKSLIKAKNLDPTNPYILNYLGYSMLEHGEELDLALGYVKQAHLLAPESAAIADSLGWGYYLNGDYASAILYLEKAVQQSGSDVTINEHIGDAYWRAGRRVDARYAWRTAKLKAPEQDAIRLAQKIDLGLPAPVKKP
jgi:tetratricopeptide (TPR) repeat protein